MGTADPVLMTQLLRERGGGWTLYILDSYHILGREITGGDVGIEAVSNQLSIYEEIKLCWW